MLGWPKKDPNVQDYVRLSHAEDSGSLSEQDERRRNEAAARLPGSVVHELDDRLRRGTI